MIWPFGPIHGISDQRVLYNIFLFSLLFPLMSHLAVRIGVTFRFTYLLSISNKNARVCYLIYYVILPHCQNSNGSFRIELTEREYPMKMRASKHTYLLIFRYINTHPNRFLYGTEIHDLWVNKLMSHIWINEKKSSMK